MSIFLPFYPSISSETRPLNIGQLLPDFLQLQINLHVRKEGGAQFGPPKDLQWSSSLVGSEKGEPEGKKRLETLLFTKPTFFFSPHVVLVVQYSSSSTEGRRPI